MVDFGKGLLSFLGRVSEIERDCFLVIVDEKKARGRQMENLRTLVGQYFWRINNNRPI